MFEDVSRLEATPEAVFFDRRRVLKGLGFIGLGGASLLGVGAAARTLHAADVDPLLAASLRPTDHFGQFPCERSGKFTLDRAITRETEAAQYNNFYEFGIDKSVCWREAQKLSTKPWTLEVAGLVERPKTLDVAELMRRMPCEERLYRFRCVERWAMAVPWSGFPLKSLMALVRPLSSAKFVRFVSFLRPDEAVGQKPGSPWKWPYYEGLTIKEAACELAFVATGLYGHALPKQHGAPLRMVIPWKYGYKGAKSIVKIEFVKDRPRTFWNDANPREYGFYSNVNPGKPHPRWSQEFETMIGTGERRKTQMYNGYGALVGGLYKGDED